MQIKETCCLFFLVVENWWDKISLAVTREDRRKYIWCSNASSWKSTPDCFTDLYIAFLRSVKGHFGNEKHSWYYGPTTLKAFGFSCRNSSVPFLLRSFHAPVGWKGCGECHHFKQHWERTAFPCSQEWVDVDTHYPILREITEFHDQVLWSCDLSTAPVNLFWYGSFPRVLTRIVKTYPPSYSLKKRFCRSSDVKILIPLLAGEQKNSSLFLILSAV